MAKSTDVDSYIYGGPSRMEAKEMLIDGNKQLTSGQEFQIPYEQGFLIVAYPNHDEASGDFAFEYWVDAYKKGDPAPPPPPPKEPVKEPESVK